MSLAFGVALCALLLAEYARCARLPWIGTYVEAYYTVFMDTKDQRSAFTRTHMYLLCGCASTVWLREALLLSGSKVDPTLAHWGWISVGVGDAMVRLFVRIRVVL
jgi:hypothetical protein